MRGNISRRDTFAIHEPFMISCFLYMFTVYLRWRSLKYGFYDKEMNLYALKMFMGC